MRFVPIAALAGLVATAATASVDTTPPPGGVYRLKPGLYVAQGTPCSDPPNAAIRSYDGRGLSTPHSHACRVRILARHGQRFTVAQTCLDTGTGPGARFVERQEVTVPDALTVSIRTRGPATTYRYCPIDQLPASLRPSTR
ncbi:hypothetical protein [Sphingomonas morindae]|uniref:Uncharacterized protein n=1 Tax=Sphingomonas morindae TaxID=1541170 RepID=A0ABY4XCW3_9SPHN|nr:hypothetical protein [Sphingomonas morindae]USI74745.1 hypothetical protein LHA26_18520 [Sphingomonas morindae]